MAYRINLRTIAMTGLLAVTGLTGCGRNDVEPVRIVEMPVDQVFRMNQGYNLFYADKEGRVFEQYVSFVGTWNNTVGSLPRLSEKEQTQFKGLRSGEAITKIYKDLPAGKRGYCRTLEVRGSEMYNEIHLPVDGRMEPGLERVGKAGIEQMQEIK